MVKQVAMERGTVPAFVTGGAKTLEPCVDTCRVCRPA